jgi:hypothetical protein
MILRTRPRSSTTRCGTSRDINDASNGLCDPPLNHVSGKLTRGWQLISIASLFGRTPFTANTESSKRVQGRQMRTGRSDRKAIALHCETQREDYFGREATTLHFSQFQLKFREERALIKGVLEL